MKNGEGKGDKHDLKRPSQSGKPLKLKCKLKIHTGKENGSKNQRNVRLLLLQVHEFYTVMLIIYVL